MFRNIINQYFLILVCFFVAQSCAWNSQRMFGDSDSTDLTNSFELEDEQLAKFKVVEEPSKEVENKKEQPKEEKKKITKTKKPPTKKSKKLVKAKQVKAVKKKKELPEDYPKKFLDYDKKSKKVWASFKPIYNVGEKFVFEVSYIGVTAGHVSMEVKPRVNMGGKEAYHFKAKLTSADFYKYIYSLDDTIESYVEINRFVPIKYSLLQRESSQKVDDLQLFDQEERKTYVWYRRDKKGKLKKYKKSAYTPELLQDSFSALFFARGLPMKIGDVYQFPVVTRGKVWLCTMKVDSYDTIEIMDKDVKAIKIKAETKFPGALKKKGDIIFWYSADAERRLLKFEAKIKIGAVAGELIHYKR